MSDYGKAIGGILGTALVLHTTRKYLLPANKKLFRKIQSKGGKKK